MIFKYFVGCKNLEEVKNSFKYKAKEYHPDLNNNVDVDIFIGLRAEYEYIIINKINFPINSGTYFTTSEGKQMYRNKRKYTKKQTASVKSFINKTFSYIKFKKYKPAMLIFKYIDYIRDTKGEFTLEDLIYIGEKLEYNPKWAEIKFKELTEEFKNK